MTCWVMDEHLDIWNVLHDGSIERIDGAVPGELRVRVGIAYLTERLIPKADFLEVVLYGCRRFRLAHWETETVLRELDAIAALEPEILSTDSSAMPIEVATTIGMLGMDYDGMGLFRDDGARLEYKTLVDTAERYWDRSS